MVSSAIALIAVTNYITISLLGTPESSTKDLLSTIWPIALPSSVAVILVMSVLYHTLQDVLAELDRHGTELIAKAQRDPLTGVASRAFFQECLAEALIRFEATGERFAVLMLDLDHFKRVNDVHGHHVGDELLKRASERLRSQMRACDTVARFGGDEFLILQAGLTKTSDVRHLCKRLGAELKQPYQIGGLQLRLPTSVGAVIASERFAIPSDYMRAADVALYEAKEAGRDCFRLFSEELDNRVKRRDRLETDLRAALRSGTGVAVHFQPQISATGRLSGVEALFRWNHPLLGEIPACEAVQIAEDSDLIDVLGEFVLRRAAAVGREYPQLSIGVNLSPAQFARCENISQTMRQIVEQEQVEPGQIEFEITERLFMEVDNSSDSQIQSLRDCGFRIALDDFGTGYSSLSYLRRFRVDRLKLDKSFAATADLDQNIALLRAAVSLAHHLNLEVIAEGIETEVQESIALESGCDALQGYRYAAPMAAAQLNHFIDQRLRNAA
jgi:diguanylate cyclase (GGDEF)-like protein